MLNFYSLSILVLKSYSKHISANIVCLIILYNLKLFVFVLFLFSVFLLMIRKCRNNEGIEQEKKRQRTTTIVNNGFNLGKF